MMMFLVYGFALFSKLFDKSIWDRRPRPSSRLGRRPHVEAAVAATLQSIGWQTGRQQNAADAFCHSSEASPFHDGFDGEAQEPSVEGALQVSNCRQWGWRIVIRCVSPQLANQCSMARASCHRLGFDWPGLFPFWIILAFRSCDGPWTSGIKHAKMIPTLKPKHESERIEYVI